MAYPRCDVCGLEMTTVLLNLEEDDVLPFRWGEAGTAQVVICAATVKWRVEPCLE